MKSLEQLSTLWSVFLNQGSLENLKQNWASIGLATLLEGASLLFQWQFQILIFLFFEGGKSVYVRLGF